VRDAEENLLAVLNSAPVIDGEIVETLANPELAAARDDLQAVIRGKVEPETLARHLKNVRQRPVLTEQGLEWILDAPQGVPEQARLVIEWAQIARELPGRLRPCANPDCNKFLIDHSKPNTAKWCSMSECGNRMKARRHYARHNA
jgi:predicted RNA-binding Zn ribbon-like protein